MRQQALIIAESANLILLPGRHVARDGKTLEDHGTPGNLTAAESEQAIAADRATYEGFGQALHDVGVAFLKDCKYGYDAKGTKIRQTLLRTPT